mmetsp:Transcript_4587/g.8746  ORF Transcript_4587/g.8746 Transcript_4587/m.8746 type:complete len:134 (-) Transcript_4587:25-426(-)
MAEVDGLLNDDKKGISQSLSEWLQVLNRSPTQKNRQYNQRDIKALLVSGPSVIRLYKSFVESLLSCSTDVKCEVMKLEFWPDQGDLYMRELLLGGDVYTDAFNYHLDTGTTQAWTVSEDYSSFEHFEFTSYEN